MSNRLLDKWWVLFWRKMAKMWKMSSCKTGLWRFLDMVFLYKKVVVFLLIKTDALSSILSLTAGLMYRYTWCCEYGFSSQSGYLNPDQSFQYVRSTVSKSLLEKWWVMFGRRWQKCGLRDRSLDTSLHIFFSMNKKYSVFLLKRS